MDNGYLCDYDMYGGREINLKDIKIIGGEYSTDEMAERVLPVNGDVVRDWKQYNPTGSSTICVGVSVEHSAQLATLFNEAGISAAAVDGKTPRTQRKQIFSDFRAGRITVLCACAVVDEGLDVPEATCLQLVRGIRSLRLYRQLIGRVLRPADSKDKAIIIDHGGSWRYLPMPDAQIDWSLDDRLRRPKKDIPSDREREYSTGRIVPAVRVQEGRDDLFLIRASTPQEVARERVQRSFKKAVRLYEKGILPSSAMRTQMRMAKFLDDDQLATLSEICNLPPEWM
jgi:superfamily II DNA or RNA helicase